MHLLVLLVAQVQPQEPMACLQTAGLLLVLLLAQVLPPELMACPQTAALLLVLLPLPFLCFLPAVLYLERFLGGRGRGGSISQMC